MIDAKAIVLLLLAFLAPLPSHGAGSPFEIDLKELEGAGSATGTKPGKESSGQKSRTRSARTGHKERVKSRSEGYLRYTVQPGDHIFKILTGRIGMPNDEAERLIPGIIRTNRIRDIKNLTVGDTLLIPNREQRRRAAAKGETVKATAAVSSLATEAKAAPATKEPTAAAPVPLKAPVAPATPPAAPPTAPAAAPIPRAAAVVPPAAAVVPPSATATPPVAPAVPPAAAAASTLSGRESGAPLATTWICPVPERDPAAVIDSLLALLQARIPGEKVLNAGQSSDGSTSVEVDRYFEYKGGRYIVSIGESDARSYTLLRVLETTGYKVLTLDGREGFRDTAEKLLRLVGVAPEFGRHPLDGGKGINGFLLRAEGTMGRRVVMSAERLEAGEKWVLAPECGAR